MNGGGRGKWQRSKCHKCEGYCHTPLSVHRMLERERETRERERELWSEIPSFFLCQRAEFFWFSRPESHEGHFRYFVVGGFSQFGWLRNQTTKNPYLFAFLSCTPTLAKRACKARDWELAVFRREPVVWSTNSGSEKVEGFPKTVWGFNWTTKSDCDINVK